MVKPSSSGCRRSSSSAPLASGQLDIFGHHPILDRRDVFRRERLALICIIDEVFVSRQAKSSTRVRLVTVARRPSSQLEFSSAHPCSMCRDSLWKPDAWLLGDWILFPIDSNGISFFCNDMSSVLARWVDLHGGNDKAYVVYTRAMCFHGQHRVDNLDQ